jgi:hypothetical protein
MTETRNYHHEITEERDRLRAERDELLDALRDIESIARMGSTTGRFLETKLNAAGHIASVAIWEAERRR